VPDYVLHRDHTLQTLAGRSIAFRKGAPTWGPPECEKDAIHIGAVPVEGEVKFLEDEQDVPVELSMQERTAKLNDSFAAMEARNGVEEFRNDFTAQGVPNLKVLSALTGFEVLGKERDEAWKQYRLGNA